MISPQNKSSTTNNSSDDGIVIHEESTNNIVFTVTKTSSILAKSASISYPSTSAISTPSTSSMSSLNKILVNNKNGTSVFITSPSNEIELQLFRVMQHASLLSYYGILLEMGGDDLNQLCEAPEDEFLEIMSLVGMAQKPLHVRRFQKSLLEWVKNPDKFKDPLNKLPNDNAVIATTVSKTSQISLLTPTSSNTKKSLLNTSISLTSTSILKDWQIECLEKSAQNLVKNIKPPELKRVVGKSKNQSIELNKLIKEITENGSYSIEDVRKYAAIYGRFDCKRKPEKPLTLHEAAVNEAAAQICCLIPQFLTRRNELFPLARQVVRDSGYHYNEFCQLADEKMLQFNSNQNIDKRPKLNSSNSDNSDEQNNSVIKQDIENENENDSFNSKSKNLHKSNSLKTNTNTKTFIPLKSSLNICDIGDDNSRLSFGSSYSPSQDQLSNDESTQKN